MIVKQKDMETLKTIWRGFSGIATLAALVMTAIGGVCNLFCDGHYIFVVALIVVLGFAIKPMWNYIQKSLM